MSSSVPSTKPFLASVSPALASTRKNNRWPRNPSPISGPPPARGLGAGPRTFVREGHKYYSTALIGQWRRNDKWAEALAAGPALFTDDANAELTFDGITLAMVKSNRLYTMLTGVLSVWLDKLKANPQTMTTADGLKAFQLIAPALESLAALRVKIGEQRMEEAGDVPPSGVSRD